MRRSLGALDRSAVLAVMAIVAGVAVAGREPPQPARAPVRGSAIQGIWTSAGELAILPTKGPAWESLSTAARRSAGIPRIRDKDDKTDTRVLAKALVYARTGERLYRDEVINACMEAIGTERGGKTLAQHLATPDPAENLGE